ncbi:hypothetical protein [Nonomuraea harbinensis]|uniref:Uncharacterized protein n=1 Tax=Nonomuraea harbinensis TaxID=1286938 RepID=A0ABW1CAA4_9ACTN|nr:hypothetical protein [Nonomuraea harbinensis]
MRGETLGEQGGRVEPTAREHERRLVGEATGQQAAEGAAERHRHAPGLAATMR